MLSAACCALHLLQLLPRRHRPALLLIVAPVEARLITKHATVGPCAIGVLALAARNGPCTCCHACWVLLCVIG